MSDNASRITTHPALISAQVLPRGPHREPLSIERAALGDTLNISPQARAALAGDGRSGPAEPVLLPGVHRGIQLYRSEAMRVQAALIVVQPPSGDGLLLEGEFTVEHERRPSTPPGDSYPSVEPARRDKQEVFAPPSPGLARQARAAYTATADSDRRGGRVDIYS